jgi:hypothetical protein
MGLVRKLGVQRQTSIEWCCVVAEMGPWMPTSPGLGLGVAAAGLRGRPFPVDGAIFNWQPRVELGKRSGRSWTVQGGGANAERTRLTDSWSDAKVMPKPWWSGRRLTHSQIRMQRTAVFSQAQCQIPSPIVCARPKLHGGRLARAQVTLDVKPHPCRSTRDA